MYFPIGWPKQLNVKHNAHHLAANNDRTFIAVISNKTIGIWFCKVSFYCFIIRFL